MTAIPVLLLIILGFIIFVIIKQMINSNPKRLKKADEDYINSHVKQFAESNVDTMSDNDNNA